MQAIAQIITKIIDFCYRPFSGIIPLQLFRYGACGGMNMVLDWVLYCVVYNFVVGHDVVAISMCGMTMHLSAHVMAFLIVFPVTLLTGFWLNRNVTFTQSSLRGYKQLSRYILIVVVNLLVNYVGLKLLVDVCGIYPTPSKIIITLVTVMISFFGQKYFSFR